MRVELIPYKNALLVQRKNGVDIVDPVTKKWKSAKSLHAAKWNLSVWQRLCREFASAPKEMLA